MKLPVGKVPPFLLDEAVFRFLGAERSDVLFGPSKGEDAAIVKVGRNLLALHCDPISGAYGRVGWIAVNIATNDIATRGVVPRWVLTCVLLPEGSDRSLLESICSDMGSAAKKLGVAIVGGHSEVTPGLDHPVVVVFPVGVARGRNYIVCRNIRPGNKIILTKSIGIEGTAILAHDREEAIRRRLGEEFVTRSKAYFNDLSILTEALAAFTAGGVRGMHDPTEGGLAGGLNEMCDAAGVGFRVYEDQIPIRPETIEICRLFKANPLALISSGCLLIAAEAEKTERIRRKVTDAGVPAAIIGETLSEFGDRVVIRKGGQEEKLPMPLSDELWSALTQQVD